MKKFNSDIVLNPSFNSVTELTNITFNPTNYVENRMATEEQISQLYKRIVGQETRRDRCCRDVIIWEAHVQVVRMNTLNLNSYDALTGGGQVISSFDENVEVGTMRRGLVYTVTFPLKWNNTTYVLRNVYASSTNNCSNSVSTSNAKLFVNYRLVEENSLTTANCTASTSTLKGFWYGTGANIISTGNNSSGGHIINPGNVWDNFVHEIAPDGTVTIKDLRRNTNFNVIRYYTQWILRQTADGQTIPDPTPVSP